jgi:hypothetical protein
MDFWFEFFNIHMNEKTITCNEYHGFKWQNIKIHQILIVFPYNSTPFLACWIMTTRHEHEILELTSHVFILD